MFRKLSKAAFDLMTWRQSARKSIRRGNILVLIAILLPVLIGIVGLVIDSGLMMDEHRNLQHATDAAATAAAMDLRSGKSSATATATATSFVNTTNGLADATVTVNIPPTSGLFAGQASHAEVIAQRQYQSHFIRVLDGFSSHPIRARTVAGVDDATAGAAIVVLDPNPANMSVPSMSDILAQVNVSSIVSSLNLNSVLSQLGLGARLTGITNGLTSQLNTSLSGVLSDVGSSVTLPALPTLTAGLEVEGLGRLIVNGSILVNTKWGGEDEKGNPVGIAAAPPYGVACMPVLALTRVQARDIRVVGGVDDFHYYQPYTGQTLPLQANRLAVPDPFETLPVPTTANGSGLVSATTQGGHRIYINVVSINPILQNVLQPILGVLYSVLGPTLISTIQPALTPLLTPSPLQPGVYDSLTVISLGEVQFQPGVYIIRSKSPITQMSLCILGGYVTANHVMFYVTDSSGYNATTGSPDSGDDQDTPPSNSLLSVLPSVLIAPTLSGSSISGLNSGSFSGLLVYQRRLDRRPILIAAPKLLGANISGTIYSKWGHVIFTGGQGSYDLSFVCGTMRILTLFDTTLAPSTLLSPARDVFLLE